MAAAGLGNMISDLAGLGLADQVTTINVTYLLELVLANVSFCFRWKPLAYDWVFQILNSHLLNSSTSHRDGPFYW